MPELSQAFELVLTEPDGSKTALVLPSGTAFVGSSAKCGIVINHPSVAPVHVELITSSDGTIWIRDLAFRNDTFLNGQPVKTSKLEHGAFIRLGKVELCVRAVGGDSGEHGTSIRQSATPASSLPHAPAMASGPYFAEPTPSGLNAAFPPTRPSGERPALRDSGVGDDGRGLTRISADVISPEMIIADRYKIVGKLSEGGMGEVYRALHIELDKPVALKVMKQALGDDPGFAERFKREAVAASRIGQQNICDVSDFGRTSTGRFFFVMELLDGQTLGELIRQVGAVPIRRAISIMNQLCHALGAAHNAGIIHRDLKPENVMLLQRPRQKDFVKVLDFGVAKVRLGGDAVGTQVGLVIGTPQYMAPEQASGLLTDARTDVYALGLIFFEMLQGRPAFDDQTPGQLMAAQIYKQPPRLMSAKGEPLPAEVQLLISRMLAKAPAQRPQTMEDVLTGLEECLTKLGTSPAAGSSPSPSAPAPVSRSVPAEQPLSASELAVAGVAAGSRKWPLMLGAALLVATGLGLGLAFSVRGAELVRPAAPIQTPPAIATAAIATAAIATPLAVVKPAEPAPALAPKPANKPTPSLVARPRPTPTPVAAPARGTFIKLIRQERCAMRLTPASLKVAAERIFVPEGISEVRLEADCGGAAQLLGADEQPYAAGVFGKARPLTLRIRN